ncbi:hypothetical protein [Polycladidibacter hongkongensis]|uniref:hypothetical protein n=1 Tax=Polycladidibacter hongkongensis TaxID=1647556 RepID=UPI0009E809AF|nr:hypothetical protein [Pseudovibrio hongkongensis]
MSEKDWCLEAERLRAIYEEVRDGNKITESRFGEDYTRYQNASLSTIRADLNEAEQRCEMRQNKGKRRRYAARLRARRY